ncbi:unnamed protein product, partial [Mycena citricolor]
CPCSLLSSLVPLTSFPSSSHLSPYYLRPSFFPYQRPAQLSAIAAHQPISPMTAEYCTCVGLLIPSIILDYHPDSKCDRYLEQTRPDILCHEATFFGLLIE